MRTLLFIAFLCTSLLANDKVSLQLKWKYQFQFAGFIVAKEKGFYRDAGLDVDILEFDDSVDALSDVLNGKTTFALGDSSLVQSSMNGSGVVAMMAIFQESLYALMVLESSGINLLEAMNSKKISIYENVNGVSLKAMLSSRNISYEAKPMEEKIDNLLNKEIDATAVYLSNEPYLMQELGIDIKTFDPKDYGFKGYGDILYTSRETINKNPELVQKMYEMSKKGWEYAFAHEEEIVDLIYEKYNSLNKSKKALHYEAKTLKKLSGYGSNFGELNKDKIQSISHLYSYMVTHKYNKKWLDSFIYKENKFINNTLTTKEKEYLKNKKEISVCVQAELYPLDAYIDNKHTGMVGDIYTILKKNMQIKFKYFSSKTDQELNRKVKYCGCDIISIIAKNQKRFPNFKPTKSFFKGDFLVISKNDKSFLRGMNDFKNKRFVVRYNSYKDYIFHFLPDMEIEVIHDILTIKELLLNDEIYGMIDINYLADIAINTMGYKHVKINGFIPLDSKVNGSIAVRNSEPMLLNILNKELQKIPSAKISEIKEKWKITRYTKEVDYELIIYISILFLLLSTIGFIWTYIIQKKNKALKKAKNKILYLNNTLEDRVKEEVRKNEEQQLLMLEQSRLAQRGEIINMIAHQWKQPLNNLSLLTQTVVIKYKRDMLDDAIMTKFNKRTQHQIIEMSNIIDDFRNFFKPVKEKVIFEISDSIDHAINILIPILNEENIQISRILNPCFIEGYPSEMGQTIINIINNAKDALVEKNIDNKTIEIKIIQERNIVKVTIEDNAGGIPENIIENIFNPYFSTKNKKNGTGLGLYMSKIIIEEHMQGKLNATNTNKGALFTLEFSKVNKR